MNFLDRALPLIERGFSVIPLKPAAKDTPKDHSGEAATAKQAGAPLAQDPAVVRSGIKGKGKKE